MRVHILMIMVLAVLLSGCSAEKPPSEEYKQFVKKYGNSKRFFCDESTGFLMKEYFFYDHSRTPYLSLVENDLSQPVRCGDANIAVLETAQGTIRED